MPYHSVDVDFDSPDNSSLSGNVGDLFNPSAAQDGPNDQLEAGQGAQIALVSGSASFESCSMASGYSDTITYSTGSTFCVLTDEGRYAHFAVISINTTSGSPIVDAIVWELAGSSSAPSTISKANLEDAVGFAGFNADPDIFHRYKLDCPEGTPANAGATATCSVVSFYRNPSGDRYPVEVEIVSVKRDGKVDVKIAIGKAGG